MMKSLSYLQEASLSYFGIKLSCHGPRIYRYKFMYKAQVSNMMKSLSYRQEASLSYFGTRFHVLTQDLQVQVYVQGPGQQHDEESFISPRSQSFIFRNQVSCPDPGFTGTSLCTRPRSATR